jgi:hypothetical protein
MLADFQMTVVMTLRNAARCGFVAGGAKKCRSIRLAPEFIVPPKSRRNVFGCFAQDDTSFLFVEARDGADGKINADPFAHSTRLRLAQGDT